MARFRAFTSGSEDSSSGSESPAEAPRPAPTKPANGKPRQPSYAAPEASSSSDEIEGDDIYAADNREDEDTSVDEGHDAAEDNEGEEEEPTPWAKQLNLEPHRVNVMQSSLFRGPDLVKVQDKNNFSFLRHRRPSDAIPDPKGIRTKTRTSFSQPQSQPPPRKYVRVALSESVCSKNENTYMDAGLSMGRSFRVGWGPGNKFAHVGGLTTRSSSTPTANSSIVNVTKLKFEYPTDPDILEWLLTNSNMGKESEDNENYPSTTPKSFIKFSSFSALFSAQDRSHAAKVLRLGHALFDPLDLHLKDDVPADIRERISDLRRADALSSWLSRTVSSSVEQDIKAATGTDPAQLAFLYLSGNQVEKAVETLMDAGNVRLATIVSQIPGDEEFRIDLRNQLQIWMEEKVDSFMSVPIRKLYALASGEVDFLDGSTRKETIQIAEGLDWLRVLGLQLWYSATLDASLQDTLKTYEGLVDVSHGRRGYPRPWYSNSASSKSDVKDGLFNLIKLALCPDMALESALNPLSFWDNPRDYRMPWFLYVLLWRILRLRDFSDRQIYSVIDDDTGSTQEIEGYSHTANVLTTSFAAQLLQDDLIQQPLYVSLYLEDENLRRYVVKEMILQGAPLLDDYNAAGLKGRLLLPQEWILESQATYAFYSGDIYRAYKLYTEAKAHQTAHELAITYLAPEAILRDELDLLTRLFTSLDASLVNDFGMGGQLFINYARILSRVPELRERQQAEDAVPDAAEVAELEDLSAKIPRLVAILPDILHDKPGTGEQSKAALSHMLSKLLDCVDPSEPMKVGIQPGHVDEGARIKHIHASAYGSFIRTIEELA